MQTLAQIVLYHLTVLIILNFTQCSLEILFDVVIKIDLFLHIEDTVSLVDAKYCLHVELRKRLCLT